MVTVSLAGSAVEPGQLVDVAGEQVDYAGVAVEDFVPRHAAAALDAGARELADERRQDGVAGEVAAVVDEERTADIVAVALPAALGKAGEIVLEQLPFACGDGKKLAAEGGGRTDDAAGVDADRIKRQARPVDGDG